LKQHELVARAKAGENLTVYIDFALPKPLKDIVKAAFGSAICGISVALGSLLAPHPELLQSAFATVVNSHVTAFVLACMISVLDLAASIFGGLFGAEWLGLMQAESFCKGAKNFARFSASTVNIFYVNNEMMAWNALLAVFRQNLIVQPNFIMLPVLGENGLFAWSPWLFTCGVIGAGARLAFLYAFLDKNVAPKHIVGAVGDIVGIGASLCAQSFLLSGDTITQSGEQAGFP
jgi:hypothetical protein